MIHELYTTDYSKYIDYKPKIDIDIKIESITPNKYGFKQSLLWNLATLGKVKAYAVYDKDKLVHSSYVVKGKEKFKFLNEKDIEIGPCWTDEEYRGNGIYPAVLSYIIKNELSGGV